VPTLDYERRVSQAQHAAACRIVERSTSPVNPLAVVSRYSDPAVTVYLTGRCEPSALVAFAALGVDLLDADRLFVMAEAYFTGRRRRRLRGSLAARHRAGDPTVGEMLIITEEGRQIAPSSTCRRMARFTGGGVRWLDDEGVLRPIVDAHRGDSIARVWESHVTIPTESEGPIDRAAAVAAIDVISQRSGLVDVSVAVGSEDPLLVAAVAEMGVDAFGGQA